jgi:hypothetical protein
VAGSDISIFKASNSLPHYVQAGEKVCKIPFRKRPSGRARQESTPEGLRKALWPAL